MGDGDEPAWFLRWRRVVMFVIGAGVFIAAAIHALQSEHFNGQLMLGSLALMGISVFLPSGSAGKRD